MPTHTIVKLNQSAQQLITYGAGVHMTRDAWYIKCACGWTEKAHSRKEVEERYERHARTGRA